VSGPALTGQARLSPVVRNASALMLSTVATAAAGFVFWVVAARYFPTATVGRASALISAMTLLAALAQLNLVSLFARFLPTAGHRTRRIVLGGYATSAAMALLLAVGFVGLGWGPGLAGTSGLLFVVAVVAGAQLFIQDGVLTALGKAVWVPAKNALTAGLKLAMLVALAGGAAVSHVFLSWAVPVIVVALAIFLWVIFRLVPSHSQGRSDTGDGVAGFVSAEYVNGLISNAVAFVPPVLVATVLGDLASAHFYLPWIIGVSVTTMLWNLVTSYVVAVSGPGGDDRAHLDRVIRLGLMVVVPSTLVLATAAGPLLRIFGPEYAAEGATALRLIGLSLPFTAIVLLYAAFAMIAKRMWPLAAVQLASATAFLLGAWLGLERLGTTGPALAYLAAQAGAAMLVLPAVVRHRRAGTAAVTEVRAVPAAAGSWP
jgi:O-antigen/teichoic acid export membrane protein